MNLKSHRYDNYDYWRNVKFALKDYYGNDSEGFDLFKLFSKRSIKYNEEEVDTFWKSNDKYEGKKITIASLYECYDIIPFCRPFPYIFRDKWNELYQSTAI